MRDDKSAVIDSISPVLISLVLAFMILILSAVALNSNSEKIVSVTEDLACQAYLQTYSSLAGKVLSIKEQLRTGNQLFAEFTKYCKTDRLYIEGENQEEIFEEYADATRRCWTRYGSGELKFLDFTQREGSYCFVCAKVSFEDKDSEKIYLYRDLGSWMNEKIPKDDNEEDLSYKELSNLFYTNYGKYGDDDSRNIKDNVDKMLLNEELEDFRPLLIETAELVNYLYTVETRTIHPKENQYIIFRYNLDDSGFENAAAKVATGIATQAALGFGVKKIACYATGAVVTGAVGVATLGTAAPAVGTAIFIGCSALGAGKLAKTYERGADTYKDLNKIQDQMSNFLKHNGANLDKNQKEHLEWLSTMMGKNSDEINDLIRKGEFKPPKLSKSVMENLRKNPEFKDLANYLDDGNYDQLTKDISKFRRFAAATSSLIALQSMQNLELPNFEQYTEIIPESEFYEACGNIPNYDD